MTELARVRLIAKVSFFALWACSSSANAQHGAHEDSAPAHYPSSGKPTTNEYYLLQVFGQAVMELGDNHYRISQEAKLINLGQDTIVFDKQSRLLTLPTGFSAFQAQSADGGPTLQEVAGKGFRLRGKMAPGEWRLVWTYRVPILSSELDLTLPVVFGKTVRYRVIVETPGQSRVSVDGFPSLEEWAHNGRRFFFTQLQRTPTDPKLRTVHLNIVGLPGPSPARWVAVAFAFVFVALGFVFLIWRRRAPVLPLDVSEKKKELVEQIQELDARLAQGEIGAEYHRTTRNHLMEELSWLLKNSATSATR